MPATYSNKSRTTREPLSPKTIAARVSVAIFGIALFLVLFVFPWVYLAVGGR